MRDKVVYIHRKKTTGEVFYVGIGNTNRPYNKDKRTKFWKRIANKYGRDVELIRTGLSWEDACNIEKDLIQLIGRRDLGLGTLVNMTDGGEGAVGAIVSEDVKVKMSKSSKSNWANGDNLGRSIEVVDVATGVKYKSLKTACKELGHNLTTIANQLRTRKPKKWNTLRQVDDLIEEYKPKRSRCKPSLKLAVIDVNTNKIYRSVRDASVNFPSSHSGLSQQIRGDRRRLSSNTLYYIKDLVICSDGYETKEDFDARLKEKLSTLKASLKLKRELKKTELKAKEIKIAKDSLANKRYEAKWNIINVATGERFMQIGMAVKCLGVEKKRYRDIKMQMKGLKPRESENTLFYVDML